MKKLFILLTVVCFVSCNKYTQPSKSQKDLLTSTHAKALKIYELMAQGNRGYNQYELMYNDVAHDLDSLLSVDEKRQSNSALLTMDRILIKGWAIRQGYHKGKGTLPIKEVDQERKTIEGYFDPRIRAEKSITK